MLTVRERTDDDEPAVRALLARTADRVEAVEPAVRLARTPGAGPGLVAVDAAGTVRAHVRPVLQELAADDGRRTYAPDRTVAWTDVAIDVAADGPVAVLALAAAIRAPGTVGADADSVLWPAADPVAPTWWPAAGLENSGSYALRPPDPLSPGPLPPGVVARDGTPADADRSIALYREAVAFQAAVNPYVRVLSAGEADHRERLASGAVASVVVAEGDRLLGVCEWWPVAGAVPPLPAGRYVHLNAVAVTAAARGRGLGRTLVATALAAAGPDLDGSTLWFSPPNPIASRVWPHLGWRPLWSVWERRA